MDTTRCHGIIYCTQKVGNNLDIFLALCEALMADDTSGEEPPSCFDFCGICTILPVIIHIIRLQLLDSMAHIYE